MALILLFWLSPLTVLAILLFLAHFGICPEERVSTFTVWWRFIRLPITASFCFVVCTTLFCASMTIIIVVTFFELLGTDTARLFAISITAFATAASVYASLLGTYYLVILPVATSFWYAFTSVAGFIGYRLLGPFLALAGI